MMFEPNSKEEEMKATTISSLASEIGVSYWAVRHALRQGYVAVERPRKGRKLYLQPDEVDAIKRHFGVLLMPTEDRGRNVIVGLLSV